MFRILVDTCVWLDLARDGKQAAVLNVVEQLVRVQPRLDPRDAA